MALVCNEFTREALNVELTTATQDSWGNEAGDRRAKELQVPGQEAKREVPFLQL